MRYLLTKLNPLNLTKRLVIVFLMMMLMVPINYFFYPPNQVEAGGAAGGAVTIIGDKSATGIKTAVESTLTTINTALSAMGITSLSMKENFWDGIFHMAAKVFLRAMVRSIIVWINSGFQGSPTFVTDLSGFMRDVADEAVGDFIYNSDALNALCSPFQLDVKIALAQTYSEKREGNYKPQCTLSDVVDNVEGFMSGNFADGGWPGFIEVALNADSNPTMSYLNSESAMYSNVIKDQGEEMALLELAGGFFSLPACDVAQSQSGTEQKCVIGTPGIVIANAINKALGAGQDELIAADEVNEIFNALFSQLIQQLFKGSYGLLGLGGNPSYTDYNWDGGDGTTSYLDAVAAEDSRLSVDTSFLGQSSPIKQSLNFTEQYVELQYEIAGRVDAAETDYDRAEEALIDNGCTMGFDFPTSLVSAREEALVAINNGSSTLAFLTIMDQIMSSASTAINEQQTILDQYSQLQEAGLLHNQNDVVQTELFLEYNLEIEITDMNERINRALDNC